MNPEYSEVYRQQITVNNAANMFGEVTLLKYRQIVVVIHVELARCWD